MNRAVLFMLVFLQASGAVGIEPIQPVTADVQSVGIRGITVAPIEDTRLGHVGYGSPSSGVSMKEIATLGATWVSLTPFGRMDDLNSVDIMHDFEIPIHQSQEMLRQAAKQAHDNGLKVAIIPHLYVMSGQWRGEIDPGNEEGWELWFEAYHSFLMRFAVLAEEVNADLFSIGVEFGSSTNTQNDCWRQIIADVRGIYSGPLTYSANWDEVEYVEFWNDLDYIGINAFWPLAKKPGDGYKTMMASATVIAKELEAHAFNWNRQVLFTEFGVKSARDSAVAPWEWPEHCDKLVYDEYYQGEAYDAVFETFTSQPWFAGMFIWKYIVDPFDETQEAPTGFSPREKYAETVLEYWYRRSWY